MAGIAIADERLVMASTGAQRTRPTGVAIVLTINMAAIQEVRLLGSVEAGRDVAERVGIGIDKTVAGRNVPGRPDADHAQPSAAGKRFVDPLVQLGKRVAHVRETVVLAA